MKTKPLSSRTAKVVWLHHNVELWDNYKANDARKRSIVGAMKDAGLVSINTFWKDVNLLGLVKSAANAYWPQSLTDKTWKVNGRVSL